MNGKASMYDGPRMYHPSAMGKGNTTYKYINTFQPLNWQEAPWKDTSDVLLLSGSAGGGKSALAGEKIHAYCLKYGNSEAQILRKTKSSLSSSVIRALTKSVIGNDPRVLHNASAQRFDYDNGSVIWYDGMSDPRARERIRSRNIDICWMEEATEFDEEDYNEVLARMRGNAAPWRQVILSTNPDGPLHWINIRLIEGNEAAVYYSGALDNPHNPPSYIRSLEKLTGVQYQRLVLGRWVAGSGMIFDTWVDRPTSKDTNVTKSAELIEGGGDVIWAIDDGYSGSVVGGMYTANSHPRAMLLAQRRYDGIIAIIDESYAIEKLASNHIAEQLEVWPRPTLVVRDRAAASLDGACRENGIRNVIHNTMKVEESIKEMRTWIAKDTNGVRKVIVHPRCSFLRHEMNQYSKDINGNVIKQHDNGPDALRYLIWNESYGRPKKVDIVSWRQMEQRYGGK